MSPYLVPPTDGLYNETHCVDSHNPASTMAMWTGQHESLTQQYKMCGCHIRTWALFVGLMEIIGLVFLLVGLAMFAPTQDTHHSLFRGLFITAAVFETLWAIGVTLMFFAIHKENPTLLIPHMVMQAVGIGSFLAFAGALVMTAKEGSNYIVPAVCIIVRAILEIFFFYVIVRCMNYFLQKRAASRTDILTLPIFGHGHYPDPPAYSSAIAYSAPVSIEPLPHELPAPAYDTVSATRDTESPPPPYSPGTTPTSCPMSAVTKL